jgi:peptidoglycan/xylan/chitin deacetylase (PgdA/CDA1 family)/sulfur carrier protein ThiS
VIERPHNHREKARSEGGGGLPGAVPAGFGTAIRRPGPRIPPRRRRRLLRALLVLAIGVTLTLGILLRGHAPNPPLQIQVAGTTRTVAAGTTVEDLVRRFSLEPPAGDLLDVEGKVLKKGVYPGRILVNGVAVPGDTVVTQGDVLTNQAGTARTEKIIRKVVKVPGGEVPNPQFFLGRAPGKQIIRTGQISGKLVSSEFRPSGHFHPPNAVALTFDDGPSPTNTPKLLSVLKRFGVKATFFVIGRSASFHPDLVRAEIAAGMEVGDHSWSHPYLRPFKSLPSRVIRDEITQAQKELLSLGASSGLFRPPGGTFSPRVIDIAMRADTRLVLWSVDPKDWEAGRSRRQIAEAVLSKVGPGSIIILHDGGGDRSATIAALPEIIRGIRARGLQIVTVGEGSIL